MSNPQYVRNIAHDAGFNGDSEITAVAISIAENDTSDPARVSPPNHDGSRDYGLWQINSSHFGENLGNIGAASVILNKNNVTDPKINGRAAYVISKNGTDFSPWTTYKSGKYKVHMAEAQATQKPGNPVSDYFNQGNTTGITSGVSDAVSKITGWATDAGKVAGYFILGILLVLMGIIILAGKSKAGEALASATPIAKVVKG
jgi:hypothetical protein